MIKKERKPSVLIISGPTASGKSSLAESLALTYQLPIISADSRQIYTEMNIGTAKPNQAILDQVKYGLINHRSITEEYSAGQFCRDALHLIDHEWAHYPVIILCGGTGFYIKALLEGLADTPPISPTIKEKWKNLWSTQGIEFLQAEMQSRDPAYYQQMEQENPHRLLRALMILDEHGKSLADYQVGQKLDTKNRSVAHFILNRDRDDLYQRINDRVDQMIQQGLINEVKNLLPYLPCIALDTVGYKELIDYFQGKHDMTFAINKIKQHSRNYAKRQLTWLRKSTNTNRISPHQTDTIHQWIKTQLQ